MVGTTIYLNDTRTYHAAVVASFNAQSKKEGSETKVGNALTLEGGIGDDVRKGRLTTGLVYYASFKLTNDRIDGLPLNIDPGKTRCSRSGRKCPFRSNERVFCSGS
jgi:hypothetical protein